MSAIENAIVKFIASKENRHMTMNCTWNKRKKKHDCKVFYIESKNGYTNNNIRWKDIKCQKINKNMKSAPCSVGSKRMKTFCRGFKDLNDVRNKCIDINGQFKKKSKKCKIVDKCMRRTENYFYGKEFFNHNLDVPILHFKQK